MVWVGYLQCVKRGSWEGLEVGEGEGVEVKLVLLCIMQWGQRCTLIRTQLEHAFDLIAEKS